MDYHLRSFRTKSYWIYALWSADSVKTFVAVVAGIWTFVDILDSFKCLQKENLSLFYLIPLFLIGIIVVIITRRPVNKIKYKLLGQDLMVEVRIDDFFNIPGQKIIGTNTTFDTDIDNNIISANSLQGQFTRKFYSGNLQALDQEIERQLRLNPYSAISKSAGKSKRYDFGTTIKLKFADQYFYWFAMAELNRDNNAYTTLNHLIQSLDGLWNYIINKGEKLDIVIPLVGSGLGRLSISRKKLIAIIAQSFISASENQIFSNKLVIVINPDDIEKSGLNLFEVKDMLKHYLP